MATKFFEHFIYIGGAMKQMGGRDYQLWDEEDGFFYDVLRYPDGEFHKFAVRSLVGLIPLYAIDVLDEDDLDDLPMFLSDVHWFIRNRPDLVGQACFTESRDGQRRDVLSIVDRHQLEKLLQRVWDEAEFLSPGGIRSLSKYHERTSVQLRRRHRALRAGRSGREDQGRQLELARPDLVPDLLPADRIVHEVQRGVRARVQGEGAGRRRRRRSTPDDMAREIANRMIGLFTRGPGRPPPRSTAAPRSSSRIRTGATCCCSTSTSTATTAPASAPTTRPAGPGWSPT